MKRWFGPFATGVFLGLLTFLPLCPPLHDSGFSLVQSVGAIVLSSVVVSLGACIVIDWIVARREHGSG